MLWRNFGVTRHGRVVFYDYDEIEYLTDVNFRRIPAAPDPEVGARGRAVVRRRCATTSSPRSSRPSCSATRACASSFLRHHADLLEPEFWQDCQRRIGAGEVVDFFPYPESLRFCNRRGG